LVLGVGQTSSQEPKKLLGNDHVLRRSMKEEIREKEIQLIDLIQVAEKFVSGYIVVVLGSCVYIFVFWVIGGRQKRYCSGRFLGPQSARGCIRKLLYIASSIQDSHFSPSESSFPLECYDPVSIRNL